jgi:transcription factor C subunit 3
LILPLLKPRDLHLIGIARKLVGGLIIFKLAASQLTIVDDDHIETVIRVQYHLESQDAEETSLTTETTESTPSTTDGHGFNEKGVIACCRRSSGIGLVDCSACLDEAWNRLRDVLDSNSCDTAKGILTVLRQSKGQGTKKSDIIVSFLRIPL